MGRAATSKRHRSLRGGGVPYIYIYIYIHFNSHMRICTYTELTHEGHVSVFTCMNIYHICVWHQGFLYCYFKDTYILYTNTDE